MASEPSPDQPTSNPVPENPPAAPAPQEAIMEQTPAPAAPTAPPPEAPITPSVETMPATWPLKIDLVVFGLLLVLTFLLGSFVATNSDVWSHLAIGKSISEGTFTFGVDPYSWLTEADTDEPASFWVHQSWLYSWTLYQLHELFGDSWGLTLVAIKAVLFTLAILLLSRIGWNDTNRWFVLIALVLTAIIVSPYLLLQPIVVSFLFLSITLFVLSRAGFFNHASADEQAPNPQILWALPPLFALWANLDAWFILGPIVLGLCWAGAGMTRWFPAARVVPGRTLGLVFGAGVLACLINPYHVRVFQLPPELAYMVVKVTDWSPLRLPDAVVGAGRTVAELKRSSGDSIWTIPTISSAYWTDARHGKNISGYAFIPLIVLSLLGFTMTARIRPQPGAPSFHIGRFLLWLVFGVLALASFRLIPFFAIVAAPLTAMTLGEFLDWQQTVGNVPMDRRGRGLNLARVVSIPFVLMLLYLAWPGWLQGPSDFAFTSARHVGWDVRPNPSLLHVAQALNDLKKHGECKNVFTTSYDIADYLPWFAPEVKFGMDSRLALYTGRAAAYLKVDNALSRHDAAEWKGYFAAHDIDQVTLTNLVRRDPRGGDGSYLQWWLDSDTWRQRDGDNYLVLFSYAGPNRHWPDDQANVDWNRAAFGKVAKDQRPPEGGTMAPATPGFLALYLDGIGPVPSGVYKRVLLRERYSLAGNHLNAIVYHVAHFGVLMGLSGPQALPGGMPLAAGMAVTGEQLTFMPRAENGPAALPILMMRTTRQAVAQNPLEARCWLGLIEDVELIRQAQEDYWVGNIYVPGSLRSRMRHLQVLTARRALVQLKPDNPDYHQRLADLYLREKLFDLALDHLQIAEKLMQSIKPANKEERQFLDATLQRQQAQIKFWEDAIRQRVAKWKELTSNMPANLKADEIILGKAYVAANEGIDEVVKGQRMRSPLGLGKKALEMLSTELNVEALTPQAQRTALLLQYRLLLSAGQADMVMEGLQQEGVKKGLPPDSYAEYLFYAGAALGDYASMEKALATLEGTLRDGTRQARNTSATALSGFVPCLMQAPCVGSNAAIAQAFVLQSIPPLSAMNKMSDVMQTQYNEMCNTITLRGIVALEAGNTDFARTLFQRALDQADGFYFTERPIAERYLARLNDQKR
ncbi:MAG TPA: hypothetical protein VFE62_10260 [Gemmataceae bacterium]|nr:hypothetical protein [Gemmataceae bacterium]